ARKGEMARGGGGLLSSVKMVRSALAEALGQRALAALRQFAAHGTTTIEAKSGYGLDIASELKILATQRELCSEQPVEIVSTFLGAHVAPAEYRRKPDGAERYTTLVVDRMLPAAA